MKLRTNSSVGPSPVAAPPGSLKFFLRFSSPNHKNFKPSSVLIPVERIQQRIFLIRSQKVMLDRDLVQLYGVKPIRLREQVKRNKERFPDDFMFQLSQDEVDVMVSQNAIPSRKHLGGYLPYAFTEQCVAMLSSASRLTACRSAASAARAQRRSSSNG